MKSGLNTSCAANTEWIQQFLGVVSFFLIILNSLCISNLKTASTHTQTINHYSFNGNSRYTEVPAGQVPLLWKFQIT